MQALRFLTASLLLLGLLATLTPTAVASDGATANEGFESYTVGSLPCTPTTFVQPCTTEGGLTYTNPAGSYQVTSARADTGTKSFLGSGAAVFDTPGDLCQAPTSFALSGVATGKIMYLQNFASEGVGTSTNRITLEFTSVTIGGNAQATMIFERYQNGVLTGGSITSSALTFATAYSSTAFYHFTIYCAHGSGSGSVVLSSTEATALGNAPVSIVQAANGGPGFSAIDKVTLPSGVYVDNLQTFVASGATVFCADPSIIDFDGNPATPTTSTGASDDYGYNYRRGGTFFDSTDNDPASLGLSTGFEYAGTSSESSWDYSAKSFLTGTKALHENITIEAGTDGQSSRFRVNYHTQSGANPDDTQKGNGLTTGHFADHVEAEFTENGNTWAVAFHYVDGGGARTQLGSSVNFGDSNDATNFVVWLDTRASADFTTTLTNEYGSNWYFSGGTLHADPFIAITTASAAQGPGGQDFAVLAIRYLDDIAGNPFLEDAVSDVWNVGYGTNAALTATLGLDENLQENRANTDDEGGLDSTCIFDDAGTAVLLGSSGATPESSLPQTPDDTGDDDGPTFFNGVTEAALMGFLGIVLAASFAASMNEKTGAGAAGLAIFATMGIWVAYYLNYFGIEVVVSLTVGFVAIIFIGIKSAVSGGET